MFPRTVRIQNGRLPDVPGVYLMKDGRGKIIYVGKATSLKRRVSSYFQKAHDARIAEMVSTIRRIDYLVTGTVIEALILEANLIKRYWPPFNIREKDNKSWLYLAFTKDDFPRPVFIRGHELEEGASRNYKAVFGPYTSPRSVRAALDLLRKIFPWTTCEPGRKRACFYYHLGQCPGVCIGMADKTAYQKTIRDLIRFFQGKKATIIKDYERQMKTASKDKRYEDAAALRNKISALKHIQDVAIMKKEDALMPAASASDTPPVVDPFGRIEGYDISTISGTSTVASMVVFEQGAPAKAEYRKFRISKEASGDDFSAIREALTRRLRHHEWRRPQLLLIDGGAGQVQAALDVLQALDLSIPVAGIAKGPERKRNDLIVPPGQSALRASLEPHMDLLISVRDEAHRFAVTYHRKVRDKRMRG
ncbi:MAG: hypothetical protein RL141_387 [Candidatus Parcubacteria bacterium]|jgi:excinuclease ABC subunit C